MVKKAKNSTVAVLDIGSAKVVCFIARVDAVGNVHVTGIGHNIAQGLKAGRITDINAAEASIAQAVEAAERMAGETIKSIYVGAASNNVLSQRISSELMVTGHEISDKDLNRIIFQVLDKFQEQELDVIHSFAYDYILDGNRGIENPLGMYGNSLVADFHLISAPANYLLNISNCVARCQLEVENFISSSYASGISCLTEDEMNLGVTLLEFGGGSTAVSVFNKGHILYTEALPIGGMHVTSDIARAFGTDFLSAERIKNLYGTVILTSADHNESIEVPLAANQHDVEMNVIKRSELVDVMRARIEETLEIINRKLEASGMGRYGGNKVVITGGASQLPGLKEMVGHVFSKNVRIGYPVELSGLAESTSGIAFGTPIGMLLHVAKHEFKNRTGRASTAAGDGTGMVAAVLNWLKSLYRG
jgi:cell division protein FtsA